MFAVPLNARSTSRFDDATANASVSAPSASIPQPAQRPRPTAKLWTGRTLTALAALFLLFDAVGKLVMPPQVVQASIRLGFPVPLNFYWGHPYDLHGALHRSPNSRARRHSHYRLPRRRCRHPDARRFAALRNVVSNALRHSCLGRSISARRQSVGTVSAQALSLSYALRAIAFPNGDAAPWRRLPRHAIFTPQEVHHVYRNPASPRLD